MPSGFDPTLPAPNSFPSSAEMRSQLNALMSYEDEWDAGVAYRKYALVTHVGVSYISLQNNNEGNNPATSPSFWRVLGGGGGAENFSEVDNGDSGLEATIDFTISPYHLLRLTGNCALTFTDRTDARRVVLRLVQDGVGGRTVVSYPPNVWFPGGVHPTLSAAPDSVDLLEFYFNGTDYFLVNAVYDLLPPPI